MYFQFQNALRLVLEEGSCTVDVDWVHNEVGAKDVYMSMERNGKKN